ncbi:hypothetical protein V2I01_00370 [Micromonospora sp. BRA006-A]|nr:hypothetical protein [Micromonospora sp. BRA006-A]
MTNGGPNFSSDVIGLRMYDTSFGSENKFGYASAIGVAMFFLTSRWRCWRCAPPGVIGSSTRDHRGHRRPGRRRATCVATPPTGRRAASWASRTSSRTASCCSGAP